MKRSSVLFTIAILATVMLLCTFSAQAVENKNKFTVSAPNTISLYPKETMNHNGFFVVEMEKNGNWQEIGRIPADQFMRDNNLRIDGVPVGAQVKIRISKAGGGKAHLDSVLFNSAPPVSVNRDKDLFLKRKISRNDKDITETGNETLELTFAGSGAPVSFVTVTGRIEPPVISKEPLQYPKSNSFLEPSKVCDYYTYRLNDSKLSPSIDGDISEFAKLKPVFKEMAVPGSGHPAGYSYGWAANDDENLYFAIDFTTDNTMDGGVDYAKIIIKTGEGNKVYKVSVPEKKWGKTSFAYTGNVKYQHKAYEFAIPLDEIDIENGEVKFAVAAYGTSAVPGEAGPRTAYDPLEDRFLAVYYKPADSTMNIYGQFINPDGTPEGSEFIVMTDGTNNYFWPDVEFSPTSGKYFVAAVSSPGADRDIYGQIVNRDGTREGSPFVVCNAADHQINPGIAWDSINDRFFAVWPDQRAAGLYYVYGQIVNPDGTLYGTTADVNTPVSTVDEQLGSVRTAFDSANGRFLVTWYSGSSDYIKGQLINADDSAYGTAVDTNFYICNYATEARFNSDCTFDCVNNRFLAVWQDNRDGNYDIFGQLVNADGSLYSTASNVNFKIADEASDCITPLASFNDLSEEFLVIFEFAGSGVYGRYLNGEGSPQGSSNFELSSDNVEELDIEFNSSYKNFMTVWQVAGNPTSLGFAAAGSASLPGITVNPTTLTYDSLDEGETSDPKTVTVTNDGTGDLACGALSITGSNADQFAIQNDNVSGKTLAASENATVQVVFSPTAATAASKAELNAVLNIPSNDDDESNVEITLTGNSITPAPSPSPTQTASPSPSPTSTPQTPELMEPSHGSTTGTDVTFKWKETENKAGDFTYTLRVGTDPDLANPDEYEITPESANSGGNPFHFAGLSFMVLGLVAGAGFRKKGYKFFIAFLLIGVMMFTLTAAGCGSGSSGSSYTSTETVSYTVHDLEAGTTYYWNVTATNTVGGSATSETWTFTTNSGN